MNQKKKTRVCRNTETVSCIELRGTTSCASHVEFNKSTDYIKSISSVLCMIFAKYAQNVGSLQNFQRSWYGWRTVLLKGMREAMAGAMLYPAC